MDNLLRLIEEGDFNSILSDNELLPKLNELIKHEFVIIKGEAVMLSEKGQEAKNIGVFEALKRAKLDSTTQSTELQKHIITYDQPSKIFWMLGLGFLILMMISILFLF